VARKHVKNTAKRCNRVIWRDLSIFHVTGYVTDVTEAHDSGEICLLLKWYLQSSLSDGASSGQPIAFVQHSCLMQNRYFCQRRRCLPLKQVGASEPAAGGYNVWGGFKAIPCLQEFCAGVEQPLPNCCALERRRYKRWVHSDWHDSCKYFDDYT
jgi:hypothetical protein